MMLRTTVLIEFRRPDGRPLEAADFDDLNKYFSTTGFAYQWSGPQIDGYCARARMTAFGIPDPKLPDDRIPSGLEYTQVELNRKEV